MFLPTSLPYYTPENTDILNKLRTAFPDKQYTQYTPHTNHFTICINDSSAIRFRYYSICFSNVSPGMIKFVLGHTGCNYYKIVEGDEIMKIANPEYNNQICMLPLFDNANEIIYDIYLNNYNYNYVGSFSRTDKLYLMGWNGNSQTLTLALKNINEIVELSKDSFCYSYNEIRQLFDENLLWIPPKRESP